MNVIILFFSLLVSFFFFFWVRYFMCLSFVSVFFPHPPSLMVPQFTTTTSISLLKAVEEWRDRLIDWERGIEYFVVRNVNHRLWLVSECENAGDLKDSVSFVLRQLYSCDLSIQSSNICCFNDYHFNGGSFGCDGNFKGVKIIVC